MTRKIIVIILILLVSAFAIFELSFLYVAYKEDVRAFLPKISNIKTEIKVQLENKKSISTPNPLVRKNQIVKTFLTRAGILEWTNKYRSENGLPPLKLNTKLNNAAESKIGEMFSKEYFAHKSPNGIGPAELVTKVGYNYKLVGENLALGNFLDDKELVGAWMNSPGHRANILNKDYTEIGISTGSGLYAKQNTWMAVQEFAKPEPICADPDESVKEKIDYYEKQVKNLEFQIDTLNKELKNTKPKTKTGIEKYNKKVDQYNALTLEYKTMGNEINKMVAEYNNAIEKYNNCINQ